MAIYPPESEEHWRAERVLEILHEADMKYLKKLFNEKKERKEQVNKILDDSDKKSICKVKRERVKRYNLTQAANILEVPRQTIYYWIKKRWIKPKRDARNYPVFTVFDIENILKWRNRIKIEKVKRKRTVRLYDKASCL